MANSFFTISKIAFLACCVAAFPQGLFAQQQPSARQVAALIEEVTALRDEVNRLRMDVEDLRAENARLLEKNDSARNKSADFAAEIAALRVEFGGKLETLRRELSAEIEKRLARANAETNAALKEFRRQVNEALDSAAKSAPRAGTSAPTAEPKDLPASGIQYKIRAGDTLTKIAREQRSKIAWILYVNPGLNPDRLPAGKEIVIPQAD
ncbi:MAG: LysM peptidoglycan-binding domain-containing protein [Candidatus Spyradosoma sp.]